MSIWDSCPICVQLGLENPAIYDAFAVKAAEQGRETFSVVREFFTKYHNDGHHQETAA